MAFLAAMQPQRTDATDGSLPVNAGQQKDYLGITASDLLPCQKRNHHLFSVSAPQSSQKNGNWIVFIFSRNKKTNEVRILS